MASPHVSNNPSKLINDKKDANTLKNGKNLNSKGNQRYGREQIQDENFIRKKVKSCQSEESDGVINDYEEEYDEDT